MQEGQTRITQSVSKFPVLCPIISDAQLSTLLIEVNARDVFLIRQALRSTGAPHDSKKLTARRTALKRHVKRMQAPLWLWSTAVQLAAYREDAYVGTML